MDAHFDAIFEKRRLTPGQLRAVAELRYDDARCLIDSGKNDRGNGAVYVGGFVLECLLKALLLERFRNLQGSVDPAKLSDRDRKIYSLLYSHNLTLMIEALPEVERKLRKVTDAKGNPIWLPFRTVCAQWTIYARYSPQRAKIDVARRFLETIQEVKRCLREL